MGNDKNVSPFSFEEVSQIFQFDVQKPSFISATDGVQLAYYPFLLESPRAVIIFYHGGGLYSNATYQYIGHELQQKHNIASYCVDIRGHGKSEGPRGDAPSVNQVLDDVTTVLKFVKNKFPEVPVYLVGHSSGAGLLLNYSNYDKRRNDLFDGYIHFAPYLGPFAGVTQPDAVSFVKKVRVWIYILNGFKLPFFQHIPAVYFNYPQAILERDPLIVTEYTYIMSCATTPHDPKKIFTALDKPTWVYIGSDDEQFIPAEVINYATYNKYNMVQTEIVPGKAHLSLLLDVAALIDKSLEKGVKDK